METTPSPRLSGERAGVRGFELENVNRRHLSLALSPNSVGGEGEKWCGCQVTPPVGLSLRLSFEPRARRRNRQIGPPPHSGKETRLSGTLDALLMGVTALPAPEHVHERFRSTQVEAHPFCFVCSASNPMGLALRYAPRPDGSVSAHFLGHSALEGYPGLLHGGVIAALLDGAMTNCLFTRGIHGRTVELEVRYHAGVVAAEEASLEAWLETEAHGLFQLRAELSQGGTVKASATGKFMTSDE